MRSGICLTVLSAVVLIACVALPDAPAQEAREAPAPKTDKETLDQKMTLMRERVKAIRERDYDAAARITDQLITLEPRNPEHYRARMMLLRLKDDAEGLRRSRRDLAALYGDSAEDLNNLAWEMLTESELRFRDPEIGLELAGKAVAISGRKESAYLDTLARAYFELTLLDRAIATQKEAVAAARNSDDRAETDVHLKYYERIKGLRDDILKKETR